MSDERARHKKEDEKAMVETWGRTQEVGRSDEKTRHKKETEKAKTKLQKQVVRAVLQVKKLTPQKARMSDEKAKLQKQVVGTILQLKKLIPQKVRISDEEVRHKKETEKAKVDEERLEEKEKETEAEKAKEKTEKVKKDEKKKKVRKANHSESSDEECKKLAFQARPKVPMADKGMTYARYEIKHKAVKHQEEWRVDKYIAEAQQIADTGYSVLAPMKCGMVIRGLNPAETQVHLIGSRLSIRAVDLEEQTVEVIKAFTDTNRVLPKAYKHWNEDDAAEFLALAKENHGEEISDETLVTQPEKLSEGKLSHIGATMGGFVAQEIMKVCSGKLMPIFQGLCFSALECLLKDYSALTASKISQKLFLVEAVEKGWKACSLDVSAAFLQGDRIDRTMYVISPKEFVPTRPKRQESIMWKLVRPLYGLTDAPRKWYCRMDREFTKLGCRMSKYDHAVYNYYYNGELQGQILLHVDDPLYGRSDLFHRKIIDMKMFTVGSKEDADFDYVGWYMKQSKHSITVNQDNYIKKVENPDMGAYNKRDGEQMLKDEEQSHFRKLVGNINWLAMNTRPDLCFDAMEMAYNFGKVRVKDIKRAGRILSKAKNRGMELRYNNPGDVKETVLMVCVDGSYGKLNKVDRCGGKFIVLVGEGGKMCPITFFTQATSSDVNAAQLSDKNWMDGGADCDYDSYITSCLCLYEYDRHVTTPNNETDRKGRERVDQFTYENGGVELRVLTREEGRKNSTGDTGADNAETNPRKGVVVFISAAEGVRLDTEGVFEQAAQEKPPHEPEQRSFVEFILKPLYKLFAQVVENADTFLLMLYEQVGTRLKKNEMKSNIRSLLRTVCSRFVEVFSGFTSMCEKHIPSPVENAKQKGGQIYSGTSETERYEDMVGYDQDGRLGTNIVVKQLTQNCYKLPRKAQVEVCETDVHRYCKKVSNIFLLLVKKQNYQFEPKKTCELEMQTRPKKTKKYNYIKNHKEQPREIRDQYNDMQDEEGLCISRPLLYGGSDLFHRKVIESFMKMFKVDSKEDNGFVYVDWHMKQSRHSITVSQDNYIKKVVFESQCEPHMETTFYMQNKERACFDASESVGELVYDRKPIQNIPRKAQIEMCKTDVHRYCEKFCNISPSPVKKQDCHFEQKKICELEMKTRPKKNKKYSYIKNCKEQPREIRDQCEKKKSIQPPCDTQERLVCTYEPVDTRNNEAALRRLVDMRIHSIMWRPERFQLADPLTKQGACRDKLKQVHVSRQADPESQRSDVNEVANDLVEATHYETLEEVYQVQRCITGKDKGRGEDIENEVVTIIWNKKRLRESFRSKYDWDLLAARSICVIGPNLTSPNTIANDSLLSGVNKRCHNTPRKTQVEVCETFSSIFTFPAKEQNYHLEPKKIYEFEMKTKKYSYIKDCKEQPKEICDWCEKKSIQPLCDTKERLVCIYKPVETRNSVAVCRRLVDMRIYSIMWRPGRSQLVYPFTKQEACRDKLRQASVSGHVDLVPQRSSSENGWNHCMNKFYEGEPLCNTQERLVRIYEPTENEGTTNSGSWNQCWTLRPNEGNCEKISNSFPLPVKEQTYRFEPKKTYELEMRTRPKKTKKDGYIKDCKEQPREIIPVKEQIYCFEPKKIYELEMETRPKKTKKDGYIKDCKEQPREICDQCEKKNTQPLRDTQERMVRTYKTNRK